MARKTLSDSFGGLDPELQNFVTGADSSQPAPDTPAGDQTEEERKRRITIIVPESVHEKLRAYCFKHDTKITPLLLELIVKYLQNQDSI